MRSNRLITIASCLLNLCTPILSNLRAISYNVIYDEDTTKDIPKVIFKYQNTTDSENDHIPIDEIDNAMALRQLNEEVDIIGSNERITYEEGDKRNRSGFHIVGGREVLVDDFKKKYQSLCSILKAKTFRGQIYVSHTCGCTLIAPK